MHDMLPIGLNMFYFSNNWGAGPGPILTPIKGMLPINMFYICFDQHNQLHRSTLVRNVTVPI